MALPEGIPRAEQHVRWCVFRNPPWPLSPPRPHSSHGHPRGCVSIAGLPLPPPWLALSRSSSYEPCASWIRLTKVRMVRIAAQAASKGSRSLKGPAQLIRSGQISVDLTDFSIRSDARVSGGRPHSAISCNHNMLATGLARGRNDPLELAGSPAGPRPPCKSDPPRSAPRCQNNGRFGETNRPA